MNDKLKESSVVVLNLEGTEKILFLMRREGWCLPGGKAEEGEDFVHCAHRELSEETGISIEYGKLIYLGSQLSVTGRIVHVLSGKTDNSNVIISTEHSEWKWVDPKDISGLNLAGNTENFLKLRKLD